MSPSIRYAKKPAKARQRRRLIREAAGEHYVRLRATSPIYGPVTVLIVDEQGPEPLSVS